jgi:hypothetical protein
LWSAEHVPEELVISKMEISWAETSETCWTRLDWWKPWVLSSFPSFPFSSLLLLPSFHKYKSGYMVALDTPLCQLGTVSLLGHSRAKQSSRGPGLSTFKGNCSDHYPWNETEPHSSKHGCLLMGSTDSESKLGVVTKVSQKSMLNLS